MSSKPITRNEKPPMLIKSTLNKTKKFLTKSFTYLKPKPPTFMDSKVQELDDYYTIFSGASPNPLEVVTKKKDDNVSETAERKKDRVEDLKEETRARKWSARKQEESGAEVLAQKMKDLEMMDLNDRDHVLDVEEVLHYYSRLTCPAYVEIVDQFFMDMYSEFQVTGRSLNASMRKLAPERNYSSMRSLPPLKL